MKLNLKLKKCIVQEVKKEEDFYKSKTDTNGRTIMVIDGTCADAHFFAGYVNVELNNVDTAEYYLINGLNISPQNSRILSELGNIYQNKKNYGIKH